MAFKPTPDQQRAIQIPVGGTIAVAAGAGTGKTAVLSEVVALEMVAKNNVCIDNILVLTFTRKAAAEMADRIEKRLLELADSCQSDKNRLKVEAGKVAEAEIRTIDSFAAGIIREHPDAAGIDPAFEVLEENRNTLLGIKTADECLELWRTDPPHPDWPKFLEETRIFDWPDLLVTLDSQLTTRRAINFGSLLLGRGKQAVDRKSAIEQIRKFIRLEIERLKRKLLDDLKYYETSLDRVAEQGIRKKYGLQAEKIIPDIQPFRKWLIDEELDWTHPIVERIKNWSLWSRSKNDEFRTEVLETAKEVQRQIGGKSDTETDSLATLKNLYIELGLVTKREALACAMIDFHNAFAKARRKESGLSFSDCETVALELLEKNPELRDLYRNRFEYVVVDEFQDTNPLQYDLIFQLCRPSSDKDMPPENLFIVGDERQSIYGFRDADWTLFRDIRSS
ncbi:MAG TPA: hypothetical protein ENN67_07845, partial [Firmicutes bacterium]|nr:hypothetical protein [Bacillota bacterium]